VQLAPPRQTSSYTYFADREVEDPEAERREDQRAAGRRFEAAGQHVEQRAGQEAPVAGQLLGQVRRGVRP
jgi:hypothetical protein